MNGKRLRQLRERAGLSQRELSIKADVGAMACSRIERGAVQPTVATLQALAEALDCTVDELLAEPEPDGEPVAS